MGDNMNVFMEKAKERELPRPGQELLEVFNRMMPVVASGERGYVLCEWFL
jgi:hypothetical protein